MLSLLHWVLALGALAMPVQPTDSSHPAIAAVKAHPAAFGGRALEIRGHVAEIRSASALEHIGLYRLVDASDTAGILVQSRNLPLGGGTFRVEAKVAPVSGDAAPPELIEIGRHATDERPALPTAVFILCGLTALTLGALLIQISREQRKNLLALPLWLLPYAASTGNADRGDSLPALRFEPELETEDRRRHGELRRRKRKLMAGTSTAVLLTAASGFWVVGTRPHVTNLPTYVRLAADTPTDTIAGRPDSIADAAPVARVAPPPAAVPSATKTVARGSTPTVGDTGSVRRPPLAAPPPQSIAAQPPAKQRPTPQPPPASALVPPPAPPPPPPPPEPQPQLAVIPPPPSATSQAPVRNPETDLAEATSVARDGASQLVAAINAKDAGSLSQLLPDAQAGDRGRLNRFLKLVKDYGPRATLSRVEAPTLTGDRGEAQFSVALSWRGDFGVNSRKSGAFVGALRHTEGGWRFDGARLLDNLP
ncbi:MAG: hypothetical protein ACREK8_10295 [Gemmatimonadales bacterium]